MQYGKADVISTFLSPSLGRLLSSASDKAAHPAPVFHAHSLPRRRNGTQDALGGADVSGHGTRRAGSDTKDMVQKKPWRAPEMNQLADKLQRALPIAVTLQRSEVWSGIDASLQNPRGHFVTQRNSFQPLSLQDGIIHGFQHFHSKSLLKGKNQ